MSEHLARSAQGFLDAVKATGILGCVSIHDGEIRSETGLSHGEALAALRIVRSAAQHLAEELRRATVATLQGDNPNA